MRRRDFLGAAAGTMGAVGVYGAASVLTTGDPRRYEPLGSVGLDGARELVTGDDGAVAYLAVDDGIATVDCSTPADPTVLAERRRLLADEPDGPIEHLWDVSVHGDRLLAVGPAHAVSGSDLHAAFLFDVHDPADPRLLDAMRTDYPIHNCFLDGDAGFLTAYDAERNPLVVVDASGGSLSEAGRWSLLDAESAWSSVHPGLRPLHDVFVHDGVAALPYWEAGTYLVDVSDPSDPAYLGHVSQRDPADLVGLAGTEAQRANLSPPGNSHYARIDETGDLLVVGREAWAVPGGDCASGGPAGIDLYDVSDPAAIEHHATIDPPATYDATTNGWFPTAHNVDLRDGRLYSSWYFGGVKLHDVSDPAAPDEIAWWRDPTEAAFWTAQAAVPGEYFLASSADGVAGYDASIPGRVYVFPDRAGRQPDPPDLTTPPDGESSLPEC